MNRLNLTTIVFGLLTLAACKKNVTADKTSPSLSAGKTVNAVEECQPIMYNLAVDSASGFSFIYKVTGSPGAGPVSVAPYVVSGTNQLKDCSGNPILRASGLAYDPTTGVFWGVTGAAGSTPNAILKFIDPNCVTVVPVTNPCGLILDLSDVERDPATGIFYAINRGTGANNTIVKFDYSTLPSINCLSKPLPTGFNPQGLTFDCNARLFVMATFFGTSGKIVFVDKTTGGTGATYIYPGAIASSAAVANPEIGLHFDCGCIGRFITGSFNPIATGSLMTDGMPSGLGPVVYNSALGALKPTVDFARP